MSLRKQILGALLVLSAAGFSPLLGAEKAQPASLTSFGAVMDVNVVNVDVYATDKNGKRVNDLRQGDFEPLEAGKPVSLSNFVPVRLPAPGQPNLSRPAVATDPAS